MYRILVSDKLGAAGLEKLAEATDVTFDLKTGLSKAELLETIPDYDALIVRSGTKVDAVVLAAGRRLKVVGRAGIGVDNIDIREATLRGIIVMNTPQANAIATAEQAFALMLATSRHTASAHASVRAGEWRRSDFVGQQLYGKTLGIVGFGRIGRLVASRAQSMGMNVLAFDPFVSEDVAREQGVTLVDFDDLLAQSDYVTLHTVMSPETESLVDAAALAKMKPTAILINTARGKLVDEQALAEALRDGRLKAAAIDVYREEPPVDNPLIGLPNVVHTPHLGASTAEAQRDVATQIVDQVLAALRGTDFRNTVNMPFHAGPDFATTRPYMALAEKLGRLHAAMAPAPIRKVELEVRGETAERLIRPVAAALLKGLLEKVLADPVNYINAPVLAEEHGISVSQTKGMDVIEYPNVICCQVSWDGGQRILAGALFGGTAPRVVQIEDYILDANPTGIVLLMRNRDVPGVIGQVGTILASHDINVGEWRMGRYRPGSEALSFINLDQEPAPEVLKQLGTVSAITSVRLVTL